MANLTEECGEQYGDGRRPPCTECEHPADDRRAGEEDDEGGGDGEVTGREGRSRER